MDPSPGPWAFHTHVYGIAHCALDRDGRVIGCNLPIGNGPLLEHAPAMVQILRELKPECCRNNSARGPPLSWPKSIDALRASRARMTSSFATYDLAIDAEAVAAGVSKIVGFSAGCANRYRRGRRALVAVTRPR
jgi:hypothetical protein